MNQKIKIVMHWKNMVIASSVAMAFAGTWIYASNAIGIPAEVTGAIAFLLAYAAMFLAIEVWPTYHFE